MRAVGVGDAGAQSFEAAVGACHRGCARGCAGTGRAHRVGAARRAPAGAQPIVQRAPNRKLHLSRLSTRRPLSKRGFERLDSPGSARGNRARLFREARRPHVPAPAPRARVYSENKRKTAVWGRPRARFLAFIY